MSKSVLRMARSEKHHRLFELIRQGNLAEQAADKSKDKSDLFGSRAANALRETAAKSLHP